MSHDLLVQMAYSTFLVSPQSIFSVNLLRAPVIISSCTVKISEIFRMSVKCMCNLGRVSLQSAKKNIVTVFHSVKAARLGVF